MPEMKHDTVILFPADTKLLCDAIKKSNMSASSCRSVNKQLQSVQQPRQSHLHSTCHTDTQALSSKYVSVIPCSFTSTSSNTFVTEMQFPEFAEHSD